MSVAINGVDLLPVFGPLAIPLGARFFVGTATTNANGQWSLVVPAGVFANAPAVFPAPISADNTAPNGAYASVVAPTQSSGAWTLSGLVLVPTATQVAGALPAKAAGQGVTVMVFAVGS